MMKPATLETGFDIQVPLFIKEGDTIRVDAGPAGLEFVKQQPSALAS